MLLPEEAAAADDIVDRTLVAACLATTAGAGTVEECLASHFDYLRDAYPASYALVAMRLRETNNDALICLLPSEGGADD